MTFYYKINTFSPSAQIEDATYSTSGVLDTTGVLSIAVADKYQVGETTTLAEILSNKYAAIASHFPAFSNIAFNPCIASSGLNVGSSGGTLVAGGRQHHAIRTGGQAQFSPVALTTTPTNFMLIWETYTIGVNDPKTDAISCTYTATNPNSSLTALVDFMGGTPATPALSDGPGIIAAGNQGNSFVLRFNNAGARVHLAGWALLY